jgi:hypothetical protein
MDDGKSELMAPSFYLHLSKYSTMPLFLIDNEKEKIMKIGKFNQSNNYQDTFHEGETEY